MEPSLLSSQVGNPDKLLSKERSSLRRLQLRSTILLASICSLALIAQDIIERYREIILFTDGLAVTIESHFEAYHLSAPHSAIETLDAHIESYRKKLNDENGEFGKTTSIFILDKSGRIFSTSIPSWKGYKIYDRTIRNPTNENGLLKNIIRCHEYASKDISSPCSESDLVGTSYTGNTITTSRYLKPVLQSGRNSYLLVVNYDMSSLYEGLLEDATLIILFSLVLSYLSYEIPSAYLRNKLLPRLCEKIQIDSLTGCSDRPSFIYSALRSLELGSGSGTEMMLILFDIASFKEVNLRLGPSKSDQVLTTLANIILDNINQDKDLLGRLESDMFAALVYTSNLALLESIAYQFELATRSVLQDSVGLRCKMGCVLTRSYGYNLDFLMSRGSRALLQAKNRSDSYIVYGEGEISHGL